MGLKRPDYGYRHPSRDDDGDRHGAPSGQIEARNALGSVGPPGEHRPTSGSLPTTTRQVPIIGERRLVDVTFAVPAHGGLTFFTAMTEAGIEPRTAILSMGSRALEAYIVVATDLDHTALLERFGSVGFEHATRRTVDAASSDLARRELDPFGVRSGRELGRLLDRVAIQHWIEAEQKLVS